MTRKFSRRRIMGEASCAGIGTTTLMSSLINLKLANNAAAVSMVPGSDRKTLVNILLAGGCDSYNLLHRRDTTGYNAYAAARADIALANPTDTALHLTETSAVSGIDYAVHPSCAKLAELFNGTGTDFSGKRRLAFVSNVGTLIQPTSMAEYDGSSVPIPKALFSHSDQIEQWQTSVPQGMSELIGAGGRMAEVLHNNNTGATAMSMSLAGNNVFQIGETTKQFAFTKNGALLFEQPWDNTLERMLKNDALESMVNQQYRHLMRDAFASHTKDSLDAQLAFKSHWDLVEPTFDTTTGVTFGGDNFSQQLRAAAITIYIRAALGLRRNTIFIQRGGWDHHQELLNAQASMLSEFSDGLYNFQLALENLAIEDEVVTYTSSDFGRTLRSNGRGSDHAWGGNAMVMGEPIDGGKVYGTFPDLTLDGPEDVGKGGRILPSTSVDEFFAEISRWFGVSSTDLDYVLPNVNNFFNPASVNHPLGIVKAGRIV